ncbi:MAG: barstar family protein [Clostridia bacterium]|jgi:Barstar, RNAse (barnase) inhibitor|nr:barstar family protein [Clostridia bacterium]
MYIIDGSKMATRKDAWDEIKRGIDAPAYMGSNLDALNDILGETRGEILLTHACKMLNSLGRYGCRILEVFFAAAKANKYLSFSLGHKPEE